MKPAVTVSPRRTKHGLVFDCYFRHDKQRIRFTISDAGSYEEAQTKALQLRDGVIAGTLAFTHKADRKYATGTFGSFRKMYEKELEAEQLSDVQRPLGIVDRLLLPRWGHLPFEDLSRKHGLDLILDLRKDHYEEQGIRRIMNVAKRYVGLAIRHRYLSANPLVDLPQQPYIPRDRVASREEIGQLVSLASPRMQIAIALGINLPLREELILEANRQYVYHRPDGLWYRSPKAPTNIKGRPLELPINATVAAIFDALPAGQDTVFTNWTPDNFRRSWRTLHRNVVPTIEDLHYHDLRRNAGSCLQTARVHPALIALILGHRSRDVTSIYKTFDSWRPDLRHAANILDAEWRSLSDPMQQDPEE